MVASANQAEAMAAFDADGLGRVRWQGLNWAAPNLDPAQALAIGQRVTVIGRRGPACKCCPASCPALERRD